MSAHDPVVVNRLSTALKERFSETPTIVCVGTDRSTGDSMGPMVGTILQRAGFVVYGTLEDPVHAENLDTRTAELVGPVLAIDACLGQEQSVISLEDGPLRPGAAVNKALRPIGDAALLGAVNLGGFMEYFVLQSTRLSVVVFLAETIAKAVIEAFAQEREVAATLL